jgi:hypothetical protein
VALHQKTAQAVAAYNAGEHQKAQAGSREVGDLSRKLVKRIDEFERSLMQDTATPHSGELPPLELVSAVPVIGGTNGKQ